MRYSGVERTLLVVKSIDKPFARLLVTDGTLNQLICRTRPAGRDLANR